MIRQDILAMFIQSGRVSIIPVCFTGEEGEGENKREGAGE